MKMSREQVKALVKECLLELLSEGLGNVSHLARRDPVAIAGVAESLNRRNKPQFDPRLDTPVGSGRQPTNALKDAIKRESGGNAIMESIFADTARTTLPAQLAAGDSGSSVAPQALAQEEKFAGTPEQVFGEETASRWANLAFMDSPSKKTA